MKNICFAQSEFVLVENVEIILSSKYTAFFQIILLFNLYCKTTKMLILLACFYFKKAVETKIVSILSLTQSFMTFCGCFSGSFHNLDALYGCCHKCFPGSVELGAEKNLVHVFIHAGIQQSAQQSYLNAGHSILKCKQIK